MCKVIKKVTLNSAFCFLVKRLIRLPKYILRFFFKFNVWHTHTFVERAYAKDIVLHLNNRDVRGALLEVGCGLGDMLRRLDYSIRCGLDNEENVISAARFLASVCSQKIIFDKFDLLENDIDGTYDVVIMCNWIHNISPAVLKKTIENICKNNLNAGGELIIDVVKNPSYLFNHDIVYLTSDLGVQVRPVGNYEGGRSVISILPN